MKGSCIDFADLDKYKHDDKVAGIEGTVTHIWPIVEGAGKRGGRYFYQNLSIKNDRGEEQKLTITTKSMALDEKEAKGKSYRFSEDCTYKIEEKDGTTYYKVYVGSKANVERLGPGGEPRPSGASQGRSGGQGGGNASQAPRGAAQQGGRNADFEAQIQQYAGVPVKDRVEAYWKIYQEVNDQYEKLGDNYEEGGATLNYLGSEELLKVTTTIFLSYNGPFKTWAPPTFKAGEIPKGVERKADPVTDWKTYTNSRLGKPLSELGEEALLGYAAWSVIPASADKPDKVEIVRWKEAMKLWMRDQGLKNLKMLCIKILEYGGLEDTFSSNDVDNYALATGELGVEFPKWEDKHFITFFTGIKERLEEIREMARVSSAAGEGRDDEQDFNEGPISDGLDADDIPF